MNTNLFKIGAAIGAALVGLGASADVLPDGKLKHALVAAGIIGAFVLALVSKWPHESDDNSNIIDFGRRQ